MNDLDTRRAAAVDFLQCIVAGRIDEAYERYVDMRGTHHNPYFAAGFPALKQAMIDNHAMFPHKQITIKHALSEGAVVGVFSHIVPAAGQAGLVVSHWFRFAGERIVEMWDCGQPIPPDSPNADGSF